MRPCWIRLPSVLTNERVSRRTIAVTEELSTPVLRELSGELGAAGWPVGGSELHLRRRFVERRRRLREKSSESSSWASFTC